MIFTGTRAVDVGGGTLSRAIPAEFNHCLTLHLVVNGWHLLQDVLVVKCLGNTNVQCSAGSVESHLQCNLFIENGVVFQELNAQHLMMLK